MDAWPGIQPGERMPSGIQWQGNHELRPRRSAVAGYGDHAYIAPSGSVAGASMQHPAFELPPGGGVAGVAADSSCALSLLSTQPWDTTTQSGSHHHRSPAMSMVSTFQGTPMSPSVMAGRYTAASTWTGPRVHEGARNNLHHHPLWQDQEDLHMVHPAGSVHHGHFSGELELAPQGSGPSNPSHGGSFGHSSNAVNWSL
jgi:hypothetical protein